jgi:hypothetical protein
MEKWVEGWGVGCLDNWQHYWWNETNEAEHQQLKYLQQRVTSPRISDETQGELYKDGIEILHRALVRSIGKKGRVVHEELRWCDGCEYDDEWADFGHSIIKYKPYVQWPRL